MFVGELPFICGSHHVALDATLAKYWYSNIVTLGGVWTVKSGIDRLVVHMMAEMGSK